MQPLLEKLSKLPPLPEVGESYITMPRHKAFEKFLYIRPGVRYSIVDRPFLEAIINSHECQQSTLQCGRQVGKTQLIGSDMALEGARNPGLGQLYLSPRGEQADTFSRMVFAQLCTYSPVLAWLIPEDKNTVWQIGTRLFKNGAYFYFRSSYLSPDAVRGLTAYRINFDEFQDLISDHITPIEECAGNAPPGTKRVRRTGTPKTFQNPLARAWANSSQAEWFIKCSCGFYNFQNEAMVKPDKFACFKCDKALDPKIGTWVAGRPDRMGQHNGWRITQIMNPNKTPQELHQKLQDYPLAQFMNEVMGLSYASGQIVLTEEDLRKACDERRPMARVGIPIAFPLSAGIDWGTGGMLASRRGGESTVSYTTLTIGGLWRGQFHLMYQKRFTGEEAELSRQPEKINMILRAFNVRIVFSDWGFGAPLNAILRNQYHWQFMNFFEVFEGSQNAMIKWNEKLYVFDRTEMFIKMIDDIKHNRISFPKWDDFKQFAPDYLSIYSELNEDSRKMRFDHKDPDDCFHSTAYAYFASLKLAGLLSRYDLTKLVP